jgi:hypothetical protein
MPPPAPPFPGLAPASAPGAPADLATALAALGPARVGLVVASRPADVPAVTGWGGFDADTDEPFGAWMGAVLRSWEDRFGARLVAMDTEVRMRLLVERPPRDHEAAAAIAAEHWAACVSCGPDAGVDEVDAFGLTEVRDIAALLIGAPVWTLAWDE